MRRPTGLSNFQPAHREECGILVYNKKVIRVVKVPNLAVEDYDYAISLNSLRAVEDSLQGSEKVIGFFHTHLAEHECSPTDEDFNGAQIFPGTNNLIYKPTTGELCWYGAEEEVAP